MALLGWKFSLGRHSLNRARRLWAEYFLPVWRVGAKLCITLMLYTFAGLQSLGVTHPLRRTGGGERLGGTEGTGHQGHARAEHPCCLTLHGVRTTLLCPAPEQEPGLARCLSRETEARGSGRGDRPTPLNSTRVEPWPGREAVRRTNATQCQGKSCQGCAEARLKDEGGWCGARGEDGSGGTPVVERGCHSEQRGLFCTSHLCPVTH